MSNQKTPDWDDGAKPTAATKSATPAAPAVTAEERALLDPDNLLTDAEISQIKAKARAELLDVKRANLKRAIMEQEKTRLKNIEGLTTGNSHQDEMVSITIDLPTFTPGININSMMYWHGRTYNVPRHVADTLRDQMHLSWAHQNQIDGKSLTDFYAQKHIADLYKVGTKGETLSGKAA